MIGIKNTSMPENCWDCDFTYETGHDGSTRCIFTHEPLYPMGGLQHKAGPDKNCPLVEVSGYKAFPSLNGILDYVESVNGPTEWETVYGPKRLVKKLTAGDFRGWNELPNAMYALHMETYEILIYWCNFMDRFVPCKGDGS